MMYCRQSDKIRTFQSRRNLLHNLEKQIIALANGEIKKQEMFVENMHIALYEKGNIFNHKETRERKLLLHKKEIIKLFSKVQQEGLTIIPLEVYISKGLCKIKIGLCKGKKLFDKRNDIKEKSIKRDLEKNYKVKY